MKSPRMRAPTASAAPLRTHVRRAGGSAGASGGSTAASCCMLGRLQDLDDAERAGPAGERLGVAPDALDEVLGRQRERLPGGRPPPPAPRGGGAPGGGGGGGAAAPPGAGRGVGGQDHAPLPAA